MKRNLPSYISAHGYFCHELPSLRTHMDATLSSLTSFSMAVQMNKGGCELVYQMQLPSFATNAGLEHGLL